MKKVESGLKRCEITLEDRMKKVESGFKRSEIAIDVPRTDQMNIQLLTENIYKKPDHDQL